MEKLIKIVDRQGNEKHESRSLIQAKLDDSKDRNVEICFSQWIHFKNSDGPQIKPLGDYIMSCEQ